MSQLIPCPKCGALCDAGNCPCLPVGTVNWGGGTFELKDLTIKQPHPLLPFPYQLEIMDGMDAFKIRLWKRNLKDGQAAG